MDKSIIEKKPTVQGIAEPPGPVGVSSGSPGSTRRSSSDWKKNGGGKIDPRVSLRAGKATGDHLSQVSRMESESVRPRAISDVKLRDVTITVLPGSGSKEVGERLNPFKPSKRLLRSPTIGTMKETYDGGDSEASFSTPKEVKVKTDRGRRYLAKRAVELSSLAGYGSQLPGGSEVEECTKEIHDAYSDTEREDKFYLTGYELSSLTRTLMGIVKALRMIVKCLGRNTKANEDLKKMSLMVEVSVCTLEQCMGAPNRRLITKPDRVRMERSGRIIGRTNTVSRQERKKTDVSQRPTVEQSKIRMVSPAEGNKVTAVTKRPRKGEPSYAEICGRTEAADYSERERSDSDGWYVVERRKKDMR